MRKLASIRKVKELRPIEGADLIELAIIDGWQCVVKKGEVSVGDLGVYFEIDSFLPIIPEFSFLEKTSKKKMGNKEGLRLKTVKLRGEVSQGLFLPLRAVKTLLKGKEVQLGDDVTELLGVEKYEAPIAASLAGQTKGNFPSFLQKTEQERIQNLFDKYTSDFLGSDNSDIIQKLENMEGDFSERIQELKEQEKIPNPIKHLSFEETLKLDGTSCTYYVADVEKYSIKVTEDMDVQDNAYFGHCSRNLETKETEDSTPWKIARDLGFKQGLLDFHKKTGRNVAIQGELMGPKIQGNRENLQKPAFYLFEIWDIDKQRYLTPEEREEILKYLPNINLVPVLHKDIKILEKFDNIEDFLEYAKGPSIHHKIREGLVYKSNTLVDGKTISFKIINNEFLLKGGN